MQTSLNSEPPLTRQCEALLSHVRLLGEPVLRRTARSVEGNGPSIEEEKHRLQCVLEAFRTKFGYGRAIAAPQIGIEKRFIALNLGTGPFVISNPKIVERAAQAFTLWDGCMSIPALMVKLERALSVTVEYTDEQGKQRVWNANEPALAELLQHEIDHLNGVLAVDHAIDTHSTIMREVYLADRDYFDRQVDYVIQPTV